jgi:hypothetical protein
VTVAVWQPDPSYEQPLPAELRELLNLVLGDMQGSEPIALQVGWDPAWVWPGPTMPGQDQEDPPCQMLIFSEPDLGGAGWMPQAPGAGVGADREWGDDFTPAELAVSLADHLQEQFFPETRGAWGQARPQCPGHAHPALAQLVDGDAWWTCPLDGRAVARFGTLAHH